MLSLSIRDRISALEALRHCYFSFWHSGEAENIRVQVFGMFLSWCLIKFVLQHPGNLFCDPLEDQSLSV